MNTERGTERLAVRAAALSLLARRDFSSSELLARLQGQGFSADECAGVITELVEGKILDDARYTELYVTEHSERGQGPVRIAQGLKALGLPDELIDSALAAGPDWYARAREVRIRKYGLPLPAAGPERARQARFLQYRGFSADHIRSALGADFDLDH